MQEEDLLGAVDDRSASDIWIADSEFPPLLVPLTTGEKIPPLSSAFPELDCIRGRIAEKRLAAAEIRATELGVGADRVLIASGAISEEAYARALAESCGVDFEPLDEIPRMACPFPDERLIEATAVGMLPLYVDGSLVVVIAPRGTASRFLTRHFIPGHYSALRVRLTSSARLQRFVTRHGDAALAHRAVDGLSTAYPALSAAPPPGRSGWAKTAIFGLLAVGAIAAFEAVSATIQVMLAIIFIAGVLLRLLGSLITHPEAERAARIPDNRLPVYTVIAALYREGRSVEQLATALRKLDYPLEKLDIKFVIEPDDAETLNAIERLELGVPFEIITAPAAGPRTKPKALNAALPFAQGVYTVIFDAEDRPEPDQLRRALDKFVTDPNLACAQARLTIDNTADGWLARFFTAEYAGLFDVFLPGLAALGLPLPLGGSSNHFRTATLRKVGAWDPYNVTEDADLGIRLSRFSYATAVIASTTYEEAPARFMPWLRQRTRWFKGWMQTWLVHMRTPRLLRADLGLAGFLSFQLVVGGNLLAAMVYPLFLAGALLDLARDVDAGAGLIETLSAGLYVTCLVFGVVGAAIVGWLGLAQRGLSRMAWVLLLIPVHWLLLSLAAWRALYQLWRDPYRWEKTEHGMAQTSRSARMNFLRPVFPKRRRRQPFPAPAGAQLARLSTLMLAARNTSAGPRPRLPAGA
jgi:cellulose synthase/poly-beta-1,6-N-acetylglucosamine synthase-like glycosyltransferase